MAYQIVLLALFVLIVPASAQVPAQNGPNPASTSDLPSHQHQPEIPTSAHPLDSFMTKLTPHPYLFWGPSLMGAGYSTLAYRVEGGLDAESTHCLMSARAAYDNGRQVNDGNQPNPKGHDRYLDVGIYCRIARSTFLRKVFLGFGERWNELSTTKNTPRPLIAHKSEADLILCTIRVRDASETSRCGYRWTGS